jgi:hypothetical protein
MKTLFVFVLTVSLAGCGAEVATTAATGAAIKKQEVEAAQQTRARAQEKIDQATQAIQQRAEQQGNVDK